MITILVLFLIGSILIGVEVFVPGGIIGIIGFGFLIGGVALSYADFGWPGVWVSGGVAFLILIATVLVEFLVLPKTKLGKRLFLQKSIDGVSQLPVAGDDVIGKDCVSLTPLSPTGFVLVDGKKIEAASKSGYIAADETLKIVGKETFRLIVTK